MMMALDFDFGPVQEIAVVGDKDSDVIARRIIEWWDSAKTELESSSLPSSAH